MSFGRSQLDAFALGPGIYLNHGTVGVPPRVVLAEQRRIRDVIEAQPSRFLLRELAGGSMGGGLEVSRMRAAAARVATFVGAATEDLVFVENTSTGVQAILRSFPLDPGDAILVADIGYGGIVNGARYVARQRGLQLHTFPIRLPLPHADAIIEAVKAALTPQTRIVIIDHVHSATGMVFPVNAIADVVRAHGARLLIDGAHAPGSLPLSIEAIGASWYVGNLHKWAWAPRSCGILWAAPEVQEVVHPTVVSWNLDKGYTHEFDQTGTRDPSTFLAAPFAIDALQGVGLQARWDWCHGLVRQAAERLIEQGAVPTTPMQHWATMGSVFLQQSDARALRNRLLTEHHIEAHLTTLAGRTCLRLAAEIYNAPEDFEVLQAALSSR